MKDRDVYHTAASVWQLLRMEMWWLLAFAVMFVGVLIGVGFTQGLYWALLIPVEMAFVLYVGRSRKSRGYLAFWMFWWFCIRSVVPLSMVLLMNKPPSKN